MNSKTSNWHTTLVVALEDGSHRTTNWYQSVEQIEICRTLNEHERLQRMSRTPVAIVGAVLLCGPQIMQYSVGDVAELAARYRNSQVQS